MPIAGTVTFAADLVPAGRGEGRPKTMHTAVPAVPSRKAGGPEKWPKMASSRPKPPKQSTAEQPTTTM
jgi:hypothetical protein